MSDTALLDRRDIFQIVDIATATGLSAPNRRGMLHEGIAPAYAASLPVMAAPRDQVLSDLMQLNRVGVLRDGSRPLAQWLRNAVALVPNHREAKQLEALLDRVAGGGSTEPSPAPFDGHFIDAFPLRWDHPDLIRLHRLLIEAYPTRDDILLIASYAGLPSGSVDWHGAAKIIWKRVLDLLARMGKARLLIEQVLEDRLVEAFHPQIREVMGPEWSPR